MEIQTKIIIRFKSDRVAIFINYEESKVLRYSGPLECFGSIPINWTFSATFQGEYEEDESYGPILASISWSIAEMHQWKGVRTTELVNSLKNLGDWVNKYPEKIGEMSNVEVDLHNW